MLKSRGGDKNHYGEKKEKGYFIGKNDTSFLRRYQLQIDSLLEVEPYIHFAFWRLDFCMVCTYAGPACAVTEFIHESVQLYLEDDVSFCLPLTLAIIFLLQHPLNIYWITGCGEHENDPEKHKFLLECILTNYSW